MKKIITLGSTNKNFIFPSIINFSTELCWING